MSTILWAINSKCNFNCKYCYLKFPEDKNPINNINNKQFKDIPINDILEFISRFKENNINRVFIAGAEPLSQPQKTFQIINKIKEQNVEVILCTNGYTIDENYKQIINSRIDAISVSLDSYDKRYNDKYRQYPQKNGWDKVVEGIKLLVNEKRKQNSNIKIGIYTVLTKLNIKDLEHTYEFLSDLGVDYYVFQPIYLDKNNVLFNELALERENVKELKMIIHNLYNKNLGVKLPNKEYIELMIRAINGEKIIINKCFAGEKLFFITPDGGIHMCPSSNCIVNEKSRLTIYDDLNDTLVKGKKQIKNCNKFSEDCVNMWQLMSFDEILI